MTRALALRLLRSYPLAWRERYEAEVRALIDDSVLRVHDLPELVHGLLTERARELISSTEHPRRTLFVLAVSKPVATVILVVMFEPTPHPRNPTLALFSAYLRWYLSLAWTFELLTDVWPRQRLLAAFTEVSMAEAQVKAGEQWVAGCEEWIAKGVPSPLAAAEARRDAAVRRRNDAQERLRALGYSAHFRRHALTAGPS